MKNLKWAFLALTSVLFFAACEKDDINEDQVEETLTVDQTIDYIKAEEAFPNQTGEEAKRFYGLNEINVTKVNEQYVFQGDILFAPNQLEEELGDTQRSTGRLGGRWADNTVYYEINPNLPNQQRVIDAIANWETNTNVRLVPRTNQPDWVYFTPGNGCSSFVGRIGGRQNITLANGCTTGSTIHEIGHAVGLWHEQSRVDRDTYITVNFDNIQTNAQFNFLTYAEQGQDGDEFTAALDFNSIMLYGSYFFSSNGLPTITRKDGSTYNVNRTSLSSGDISGILQMYPGDTTGGGDICEGVAPYSSGVSYSVGDRVTYQGSLYERTGNGWVYIGECEEEQSQDICDGVSPWSSGTNYSIGDQVTYQGNLYERVSGGWTLIGACGS